MLYIQFKNFNTKKVTKTQKYDQVFHKKLAISLTYNDILNEEYF